MFLGGADGDWWSTANRDHDIQIGLRGSDDSLNGYRFMDTKHSGREMYVDCRCVYAALGPWEY